MICSVASAQFSTGHEAPTYVGSPGGTVITGQDGFYIPVADSQDGLVYTYAGNTLGLPQNPTGREQFVGCTGGDVNLPVPFVRAQRDVTYGDGTGVWTVSFDIAASFVGDLPSAQNIGSMSTQIFGAEATFIALPRWTDPVTAANWDADYVWFDGAGVQLVESVADPAFQNLLTDHWYRWCTTFDLDTNQILAVSITDLTSAVTTTHNPVDRYLVGGAAGGAPPPTGFRYFGGSSSVAGNTLAFDNMAIEEGESACAGAFQCEDLTCGNNDNKQLLCHVPPGNPGNAHTICISPNALEAHLAHGDVCGPCGSATQLLLNPCLWDLDGSNAVGAADMLILLAQWGVNSNGPADFDGNGSVGTNDLLELLSNWGTCW